ncbi:hypothetical protein KC315_g18252 [Hortaea werneckii]|nr:hypothetical protein KC315_g18252 [Hortaea werneckii]
MINDSHLHSYTTDFADALANVPEDNNDEDSVKAEELPTRAANEAPSPEEVKVDNEVFDQANVQHPPATVVTTTTPPKLDNTKAAYDQANVQRIPKTAVSTTTPSKRTKSERMDTTLQISSARSQTALPTAHCRKALKKARKEERPIILPPKLQSTKRSLNNLDTHLKLEGASDETRLRGIIHEQKRGLERKLERKDAEIRRLKEHHDDKAAHTQDVLQALTGA